MYVKNFPQNDPGTPPLTKPAAFLWWQTIRMWPVFLAGIITSVITGVAQAGLPFVLGQIVDRALDDGLSRTLWLWCGLLAAVGVVQVLSNMGWHYYGVWSWLRAALNTMQLVGHHTTRTGSALTRDIATGEVVSTVANDAYRIGDFYVQIARFIGGLITYIVVGIVLLQSSVTLGIAVLVGLPVVAAILALIVKPLQKRQSVQREAAGELTTLGSDTVAGLRILRGIGGEDVFADRYREQSQKVRRAGVSVANTQSILDGLQALLPGLFLAGVVWFGAHLALAGDITSGQLVTFYGYAAFLTQPLNSATQALQQTIRAVVASGKLIKVLGTEHDVADDGAQPAPEFGAVLTHAPANLTVTPGRTIAVVSVDPDESAAVVTEMARMRDTTGTPSPVLWDDQPLTNYRLADIRERIVLSEATPALFSGTLRDELDVRGQATDDELLSMMAACDAHDVLASLPEGLDGQIQEKGRSLSGGQRQRVSLARALLTDAEILLLIEPTSAVDAHTESRIAQNLRAARYHRTTVIVTASPLVLEHVDQVAYLKNGRVVAQGTHRELLERAHGGDEIAAGYRAVVSRSSGDEMADHTASALPESR